MGLPPVFLNAYVLTKSIFEVDISNEVDHFKSLNIGKTAVIGRAALEIAVQIARNPEDANDFKCDINIKSVADRCKIGCHFEIGISGYFTVPDATLSHENAEGIITTHFPTMLFSAARDHLMSLTSRGPYQTLILQTMQFSPQDINLNDRGSPQDKVPPPGKKQPAKGKKKIRGP